MQPQHHCVWSFLSVSGLGRNFWAFLKAYLFFNQVDSVLHGTPYSFAIWVLDLTFLSTSSRACNFVSIDTGLRLLAITIFDYWFLVENFCTDTWLSPIRHSKITDVVCCLFFGENPQAVTYTARLYMLEWLRTSPPPLTGEQYGKIEPKYPEGGHCQSVLRPQGVLTSPLFLIIQWRRHRHITWSSTHDVVSREINLSASFHIGCYIYDCNDHNGRWTNWQWYFIIISAIYIDFMLLGLKNHNFSLHIFVISRFVYHGCE